MVLGAPRKGIKAYLYNRYTDRRIPSGKMRKDSDLFICEGMYGEKDKAAKGDGI